MNERKRKIVPDIVNFRGEEIPVERHVSHVSEAGPLYFDPEPPTLGDHLFLGEGAGKGEHPFAKVKLKHIPRAALEEWVSSNSPREGTSDAVVGCFNLVTQFLVQGKSDE